MGRPVDSGTGVEALPPIFDIAAARLDRKRHIEGAGESHGGGAVGEEKLRIDHVEGEPLSSEFGQHRHCGPGHEPRIEHPADPGQQPRPWPINPHSLTHFTFGQCAQRGVARVAIKGRWRQSDRTDHPQVHVRAGGQPDRLRLHEAAKPRLGIAGIQGGKGDYAQHRRRLCGHR